MRRHGPFKETATGIKFTIYEEAQEIHDSRFRIWIRFTI